MLLDRRSSLFSQRKSLQCRRTPIDARRFQGRVYRSASYKSMVEKYPLANIGISTGAVSKTAVVDVGDQPAWDMLHEMLPGYDFKSVPRQKAGKEFGWHLAFNHPDIPIKNGRQVSPQEWIAEGTVVISWPRRPSMSLAGAYEWRYLPPVENSRYFPRS
jgi:hypothetical protein